MSYQLMSYQLIEFSVEAGVATIAFNRPERRNAMSDDMRAGAAPAISDLLGGQIDVMFTTVASAASLVVRGSSGRWPSHRLNVQPRSRNCRPLLRRECPATPPSPGMDCTRRPRHPRR
ncbi:protein of unknown function [Bradyrhizobium vignae]|uniref:Enoyl-CoA hydratase/isomerase family protein n=1 Tax=Bradyrhizobium vignae TaxID=1549949 RepID=A0A2U3QCR0_9BRAD|nr:protein of unknown function [Bradyrhizobium vignae]